MNTFQHQLEHRHRQRDLQRQAEHQRLHKELRTAEARSYKNSLRRLAKVASLFL